MYMYACACLYVFVCVGQKGRQATVTRRCSTCDNDNDDDDATKKAIVTRCFTLLLLLS